MDHVGIMKHIGIGCAITPESSQELQGISSTNQIRVNPWQYRGGVRQGNTRLVVKQRVHYLCIRTPDLIGLITSTCTQVEEDRSKCAVSITKPNFEWISGTVKYNVYMNQRLFFTSLYID